MPPLSEVMQPNEGDGVQIQKSKSQQLARNLVLNYLRNIVGSDRLANKFKESVPSEPGTNWVPKENTTIENVLAEHSSSVTDPTPTPAILPLLVYKHIQENASGKFGTTLP